ncbi:ParB/RepB/Spo0J family partition protein [Azonexus hydrophilus]|uniref:ParB/RepB/Spo0J family partition protein n=1 Tax=Azonexus hydrophilus TaxID=418702 RepID=A0ABZ2XLM8_9RHOO
MSSALAIQKRVTLDQPSLSTHEIPCDKISKSPYQCRVGISRDQVAVIAESIQKSGLQDPITVRPTGGGYELVTGEHRLEACRLLGKETVTAIIRPLADADAAKMVLSNNALRSNLSDWETFQHIQLLLRSGFATESELAVVVGKSRSIISKLMAFGCFSEEAQAIVAANPGRFGAAMASELRASGYCSTHPELVVEAFRLVEGASLTQDGVVSWVRNRVTPPQNKPTKTRTFKVGQHKVSIAYYGDAVRISCKSIDPAALDPLLEKALRSYIDDGDQPPKKNGRKPQ